MVVMAFPECKTCNGFGEMDPWSEDDEVPCTNPNCVMGCDTSKQKVPAPDKIARAIERARGCDLPPSVRLLFD